MGKNKIVRTLCYFIKDLNTSVIEKLDTKVSFLKAHGYEVQTRRICIESKNIAKIQKIISDPSLYISAGMLECEDAWKQMDHFLQADNVSFHRSLDNAVTIRDIDLLFHIINNNASKTFNFSYTFFNTHSSPYFPSAQYQRDGFSIGLQPTDLSQGCPTLEQWLASMRCVWNELYTFFKNDPEFIGIDSSIAPLYRDNGSFINFIKKFSPSFASSVTTDIYTTVSRFLKEMNPKPAGLCGIMFPCLEDFELAEEYENGEFSIERNIYLSLHSGLGIDTYPIGTDESKQRVYQILMLLQALAQKYSKPLSARFISDGNARINEHARFNNPYLKDVIVRQL